MKKHIKSLTCFGFFLILFHLVILFCFASETSKISHPPHRDSPIDTDFDALSFQNLDIVDDTDENSQAGGQIPAQFAQGNPSAHEIMPNEILTLERSLEIAISRNSRLRHAREKIEQASAHYLQVKAGKNPTLAVEGMAQFWGPTQNIYVGDTINQTFYFTRDYNYVGQLSLQYLISTFGRIENQISAAFVNIRANMANFEAEKRTLIFEVKEAYYNILKSSSMAKVAQDYENSAKDHLRIAKSLYENGLVSKFDIVRAELEASQAMQERITAGKMLLLSRSSFLFMLEQDKKVNFRIKAQKRKFLPHSHSIERLQEIGLESRNEIQALAANLECSRRLLKAARSESNPTLVFSSNYLKQTQTDVYPDHQWDVTLSIKIPIFDGNLKSAKVKEMESVVRTAEIALDNLKRQVKLDIEKAFLDLKEAEYKYRTAIKNVETAQEGYRMAKIRYVNGLSIAVEMEDALRTLNRAKQMMVNAQYDYDISFAALERSLGRDFTPDELKLGSE